MFDDCPRDGESIKRRGASADFIEKDETGRRGVMQDGGDFAHLDKKRGAAAREVIAGTDAREDAIGDGKFGLARGNEAAHLRHQHNQRGLPKIRGLTAHVWSSNQQKLLVAGVEAEVVGDETLAALAQEFFDNRMTAANDEQLSSGVEFGARVAAIGGQLCKRSKHIELCYGGSRTPKARCLGGDA